MVSLNSRIGVSESLGKSAGLLVVLSSCQEPGKVPGKDPRKGSRNRIHKGKNQRKIMGNHRKIKGNHRENIRNHRFFLVRLHFRVNYLLIINSLLAYFG